MKRIDTRRIFDIAIAATGLTFTSPVLFGMIALSRLESGQSGLFRQTRYGLHGRSFTIYKIRTLENDFKPLPWSGLLRKTGLDELPQLLNLLKGDMSFIGPRARTSTLDVEGRTNPLSIKPGVIGLSAVRAKLRGKELETEHKALIESYYVSHRLSSRSALRLDLYILINAAKLVVTGRVDCQMRDYWEKGRRATRQQRSSPRRNCNHG